MGSINVMVSINAKKTVTLLTHAFVGWALCAAVMGVGMSMVSLETTLIIHAIAAPVFFMSISLLYFKKFNYTTPLQTACFFTAFVIFVDFFLVALVINKSLDMFKSILGTWLPFTLIFFSTYTTGLLLFRKSK